MNTLKFIVPSVASLMIALSSPTFAAMAPEGQDDRVQWKLLGDLQIPNKPLDIAYSLDGRYAFVLTNSNQIEIYQQGKLQGRIPVDEGVSAIDIAPLGQYLYLINSKDNRLATLSVDFVVDIDTSSAPIKGAKDAPVTVTVFSDFQCPYCGKLLPLLEQVLKQNPETVKVAFKNFPLKMHEMAGPSALAALAANEQGKFWEYHDRLFAESKITSDSFKKIATELNLNQERFDADMKSPILMEKLNKDMEEAEKIGITGTPAVYVNGKMLSQRNINDFQKLIDAELGKASK